jgi:Family of unknown function (DUF6335)
MFFTGEIDMSESTAENQAGSEKSNNSVSSSEPVETVEYDRDIDESPEDLPQVLTESYGTGVKEIPGYVVDERYRQDRNLNEASPALTGGDIDANYEQANAEGDESVGGTVVTPDMDIVDNLGKAVGLEMDDSNFLHTEEILEHRDEQRWELEPKSSEDYQDRRD